MGRARSPPVGRDRLGRPAGQRVPSAPVGTSKRERQKQARQEKIEALRQQEERAKTRRRGVLIGGAVVAFVVFAIAFSVLTSSDDDTDVAADTTSTTAAGDGEETTSTTEAPVEVAGTPPTTVPVGDPIEPECPPADGAEEPAYDFTGPFPDCLEEGVDYQARFVTTKGDVLVDLREDEMPGTVNNFVALARWGYYDGTDLFRTDPSIDIIQGGSPHTQTNSDPGPGYTIEDEPADGFGVDDASGQYVGPFSYEPGQLIMARSSGPDASGAQFFFSTGPNVSFLDTQGTYLLFGDVVEGLDLLQEVIGLHFEDGVTLGGRPSEYVIVEQVEIIEA